MDVKIDKAKPITENLWHIIGTIDGVVFGLRIQYKMGNITPFGSLVYMANDNVPDFTAELLALIKVALAKFNAGQHTDLSRLL